jgi:hypothetical protein
MDGKEQDQQAWQQLPPFVLRITLTSFAMLLTIAITRWPLDQWLVVGTAPTHRITGITNTILIAIKFALLITIGGMVYLRTTRFLRILGGEHLLPIQRILIRLRLAWVIDLHRI